jgi:thymidylate synthase ThyX
VVLIEDKYHELEELAGINKMTNFTLKKVMTSALRRILPNGMANTIVTTMNHRTCRHLLELRTNEHAEEEIRLAFWELFKTVKDRYPAIYADGTEHWIEDNPIPEIHFEASKV